MDDENIRAALAASAEFQKRAKALLEQRKEAQKDGNYSYQSAAGGSLRRQSMELTRALAAMRKS